MSLITDRAKMLGTKLEIPPTAFIPCPAASYNLARVAKCPQCEHFRGFIDTVPQAAQPVDFVKRYRVFCGKPIARSLSNVVID